MNNFLSDSSSAGDDASLLADPAFGASFEELRSGTGLEMLKARNYPLFCLKSYQKFGVFPKEANLDTATQNRLKALADSSKASADSSEIATLKAQRYDQLMDSGGMERLKQLSPSAFAEMRAAKEDEIKRWQSR